MESKVSSFEILLLCYFLEKRNSEKIDRTNYIIKSGKRPLLLYESLEIDYSNSRIYSNQNIK